MVSRLLNKIEIAQNPEYKIELADEIINSIDDPNDFFNSIKLMNALSIKLQSQIDLGLFSDAIHTIDQLLEINDLELTKFMAYNSKGICYERLNKNSEALDCYKKCYEIDSTVNLNICYTMGRLYEKLNQRYNAIEIYEKLLKYNPDDEYVKYKVEDLKNNSYECSDIKKCIHKGHIYLSFKELDAAKKIFEYVLTIQPDCPDAYNYLGIIYEELEKPDIALKHYEKSLKIKETWEVYRNIGNLHLKAKDYVNASENYENSININPNDISTLTNNAYCLMKLENYKDAMKYSIESFKINPQNIRTYFIVARCYEGIGQFEKAIITYDELLKIEPNAEAHIRKSLALKQLKRYDEALKSLEHAMQFDGKTDRIMNNYNELKMMSNER